MTDTNFTFSHQVGLYGDYYHSIPGIDDLYGKGKFRYVRVTKTSQTEVDL